MNAGTSWLPVTRKVRQALAAYLGIEAGAVVGELTTGTPGWALVIAGGIALLTAYLTRDESSPA